MTAHESRPAGAALEAWRPDASVPSGEADGLEFFRTSYAVLVRGKSVRRHLYFNLPAAERAVRRAEARGDRADMVLVQLVPVGDV